MNAKHLLFMSVILLVTAQNAISQTTANNHPAPTQIIHFGKKLPPPDPKNFSDRILPDYTLNRSNTAHSPHAQPVNVRNTLKNPNSIKQQLLEQLNSRLPVQRKTASIEKLEDPDDKGSAFHLTKDINPLSGSIPSNFNIGLSASSILNGVMYFAADDAIHGTELWRSDGTAAGTYMVKDIEPGAASSSVSDIAAANGKLYFLAYTSAYGYEPWVSDGTESGTHLLKDLNPEFSSFPDEFVGLNGSTYFVADKDLSYGGALYKTDGTAEGTTLVKAIEDDGISRDGIWQLTAANGLLFFSTYNYNNGMWELWRSDGSYEGTYSVGTAPSVPVDEPTHLTSYNNQLYFSADDGTGNHKLWVSDGTVAGTSLAPGYHNITVTETYTTYGIPFPVLNNALYIPGKSPATHISALYKYNPSNKKGLVKIKDITTNSDSVEISEMTVVNNILYFKVIHYNAGMQDELWSSKGTANSTQPEQQFPAGEAIYDLTGSGGQLYFVRDSKAFGAELWAANNTPFGTLLYLVRDIFEGSIGSYPSNLTALKGKLFFYATDDKKGAELFMTDGTLSSTSLVKDINTVATENSNAGGFGMLPFGKDVLFNAYENIHGLELYRSDGSNNGTGLLNDIIPGPFSSSPQAFMSKNKSAYFLAFNTLSKFSIYKCDGTPAGLKKMTPSYNQDNFDYLISFDVAENGLVYYVMYNYNNSSYELRRSDGTAAGTILLSHTLYYTEGSLLVKGNTAFFVAGNTAYGYELWKSDGSLAGTHLIKDINPGGGDSAPYGLFEYKNEVYFGAYDGANYSLWKSDGTNKGTAKLKNIESWGRFCISNNQLFFNAIDYSNNKGIQLWKTDGTTAGTRPVKDINHADNGFYTSSYYLTDVNGTLFFVSDDGVHGTELWKTDGTNNGTQLVKDITPGLDDSFLGNLVSYAGKLYFANLDELWSSDGTEAGTTPVNDPLISKVQVYNIIATSDKLFVAGYTHKYGHELFAGKMNNNTKTITMSKPADEKVVKTAISFDAILYPNPVALNAQLLIKGGAQNVSVIIADISGKKLWQSNNLNAAFINLPTAKLASGTYFVTVTNGKESKTIKLVKQ